MFRYTLVCFFHVLATYAGALEKVEPPFSEFEKDPDFYRWGGDDTDEIHLLYPFDSKKRLILFHETLEPNNK